MSSHVNHLSVSECALPSDMQSESAPRLNGAVRGDWDTSVRRTHSIIYPFHSRSLSLSLSCWSQPIHSHPRSHRSVLLIPEVTVASSSSPKSLWRLAHPRGMAETSGFLECGVVCASPSVDTTEQSKEFHRTTPNSLLKSSLQKG